MDDELPNAAYPPNTVVEKPFDVRTIRAIVVASLMRDERSSPPGDTAANQS